MVKGVNGVVVAVVAIVATVLIGGTVGALNPVTVETTDYDYITNINTLYDLEEQPVPSEYSPSGNWNGWKSGPYDNATGGISYSVLNRYNGIPVKTDTTSLSIGGSIPNTLDAPNPPYNPVANTNVYTFSNTADGLISYNQDNSKAVKLSDFYDWLETNYDIESEYETLTLTTTTLGIVVISDIDTKNSISIGPTDTLTTTSTNSAPWPKSIDINRGNGSVAMMNESGQIFRSETIDNLLLIYDRYGQSLSSRWEIKSIMVKEPIYIDTTKGITVTADPAYWSNGYDVAKMRFVFQTNTANCKTTYTATLYDAATGTNLSLPVYGNITMQMQVYTDADKDVTIYLQMIGNTGQDPATALFNLGRWPGAVIDIDLYSGIATASGIRSFGDFRNYETSGAAETRDLNITGAAVKTMRATNTGTGMTFGIDRTSVYLTASETVMVDPSITIGEHFPDLANSFQIRYDSFVKWGTSVTINGTEYTVQNKQLKNVPYLYNNELAYQDVDLDNLRITANDGELTMQYSDKKSYTAALQDPTISFGGIWYFDSDLYSVVTGTATEYEYVGGFNLDWNGSIVIYIVALAAGSFAITKFRNPTILDWLIVAFAAAAGWVML